MRLHHKQNIRRGSVLPLVAMCTVGIIGMVAMAIDIGMIAIARNQCQNAADAAAMAGARTINGDATGNYNLATAPMNAVTAANANSVFGVAVNGDPNTSSGSPSNDTFSTGDVTVEVVALSYIYNDANPSSEGFQIQFPRTSSTEPYSAVKATIKYTGNFAFGRVFGLKTFNTKAYATAVHRPRNVVIIMDLSGSMRFPKFTGRSLQRRPDDIHAVGRLSQVWPLLRHLVSGTLRQLQYSDRRRRNVGSYKSDDQDQLR